MNIFEEEPDAKVIVFTQWLPMARILGRMCQQESREAEKKGKPKWDYLTYNGEMSHDARARALDEFATDSEKRILVASLKCGGIGLNMTMASRVILLDPWWNRAIEQQAFGR
jgi:SNF2 family DNA or RNA helicase